MIDLLFKRLWTCLKTDYRKNELIINKGTLIGYQSNCQLLRKGYCVL